MKNGILEGIGIYLKKCLLKLVFWIDLEKITACSLNSKEKKE